MSYSQLFAACEEGDVRTTEELISKGVDVNAVKLVCIC